METWWNKYLTSQVTPLIDCDVPLLFEKALEANEGVLSSAGALVIQTGKFTGRATEDKYVVKDSYTTDKIDWASGIHQMSSTDFEAIKEKFIHDYNEHGRNIYGCERSVGADAEFGLGLKILTPSATHALFARHIFRDPLPNPKLGHFTIFYCPDLELTPQVHNLRSSTVIAINFQSREILIAGTGYAGEMKKAVFSVMNTLLPDHDVLPVHAGANVDHKDNVSVFFGLSGTGKTTLSTDEGKILIGDDELGISQHGIFNLEGGCYAKTYNLTQKGEPQVFKAVNSFGAILENVVLDQHRCPLFADKTITENGRGTYPLNFVSEASATGVAKFPNNIFFLSADAMGVLPAVSKLDSDQALYYFLSGYTAKLAGTEMGLAGIKATFSHCFGAPFMMRHPMDYAELLKQFLAQHSLNVWLINTGWYGGVYGVGKRFDLSVTRTIIRAIQSGDLASIPCWQEGAFGLRVPKEVPGVNASYLDARGMWSNKEEYDQTALKLKDLFNQNYKKFAGSNITRGQNQKVPFENIQHPSGF